MTDTRTAILEAARHGLEKHGMAVRLEDVAREAGVSRQSVYMHFGSRVGLFEALAQYVDDHANVGNAEASVADAPDALAALDALILHRATYIPAVHSVVCAVVEARKRDEAAVAAYAGRQAALRRAYALLVKRLDDEGLLASAWNKSTAVETLRVLLSIPTWEQFVVENKWSRKRYVKAMREMLRRTFVASPDA